VACGCGMWLWHVAVACGCGMWLWHVAVACGCGFHGATGVVPWHVVVPSLGLDAAAGSKQLMPEGCYVTQVADAVCQPTLKPLSLTCHSGWQWQRSCPATGVTAWLQRLRLGTPAGRAGAQHEGHSSM
jgi:hypothetical protein